MPRPTKLEELQQKIATAKQEADRAEGALAQILKQLKEEHQCDSLEEAEAKLEQLGKKAQRLEEEFTTALTEFEETHADVLAT